MLGLSNSLIKVVKNSLERPPASLDSSLTKTIFISYSVIIDKRVKYLSEILQVEEVFHGVLNQIFSVYGNLIVALNEIYCVNVYLVTEPD